MPDACIYDADEQKRVKYAYDHGHQVASHTWAHKDLTTLTWDQSKLSYYFPLNIPLKDITVHDEMWRVEREPLLPI